MRLLSDSSGFGTVYEAYCQDVPKILKVLKRDRSDNPKVLSLFRKEAEVLSQLDHPGVPFVDQDGYFTYRPKDSDAPLHCIVMEKIDGPNLQQWMQQQGNHPIGERQAFQWLLQLAEILRRIHQHNYFHRDIKPDNVMLRATGQLVLVDFGAAREMSQTYLAQVGSLGVTTISSTGYTPPEQEQGQAVPQSDFYALGRTIIYLLTGRSPTDPALYDPLLNAFNWRSAAPHISSEFADLLDSLIASRVIDRPRTAQEILDRLHRLSLNQWVAHGDSQTLLTETTLPKNEETQVSSWRPPIAQPPARAATMPTSASITRSTWLIAGGVTLGAITLLGFGGWLRHWTNSSPKTVSPAEGKPVAAVSAPYTVQLLRTFTRHENSVNALQLLASKRQFVSASADTTLRLWDLSTGENLQTYAGHETFVNAIALSPDEATLYSASADGKILQWDIASGQQTAAYAGHAGAVNTLKRTPDGRRLVSGAADGTIKIWDTQTQALVDTLEGHEGAVNTLTITDDGQRIISGGTDRLIRLWNMQTGEEIGVLQGHVSYINALAVSPDGQVLFSASADKTLKRWDLETGEVLNTLTQHSSYVNVLTVSRDGQTVSSGGADQQVCLWDIATGQLLSSYRGFGMTVDNLIQPSDNQIVTASRENPAIKSWLLEP
jgi:serine/threonine protein kinase